MPAPRQPMDITHTWIGRDGRTNHWVVSIQQEQLLATSYWLLLEYTVFLTGIDAAAPVTKPAHSLNADLSTGSFNVRFELSSL
jgi:hypothetical protein